MAFQDSLGLLSDGQSVTADAASTNTIDLGNVTPKRDIGDGVPMAVVFTVDTAADTADGDETYEFQVIQSANADLSSPDILLKTDTTFISRTVLVAGYQLVIPIPPGMMSKRYLGAYYNVGGTSPSITVTAELRPMSMIQRSKVYADGFAIS